MSPTTITIGAVVLVLVVVLVIVLVAQGGSNTSVSSGPTRFQMPNSVITTVADAWTKDAQKVGLPSSVAAPTVDNGQPPLRAPGSSLPTLAFVGAEYCPYCAAERWAMVMALSQFGHFSYLNQTTSSAIDVDPQTVTFSFYGEKYSSSVLNWVPTEETTDQPASNGQGYVPLQSPPNWVASVYQKYDNSAGYPFLDIGNKVFIKNPSYDPVVLQGLVASQIAGDLSNPDSSVTQAIVGTANYIVAGICSITGNQPAAVCSNPAVAQAAKKLGVS